MKLQQSVSLQPYNTLAVPAVARFFVAVECRDALCEAIALAKSRNLPWLILGGGSNLVLSGDFDGLVIHLCSRGIEILSEEGDGGITLQVAAGENWDALVQHTLAEGWFGLQNLSAIPGNVGAAPIQNIGAYGVELSEVLEAVEGLDTESQRFRRLNRADCELAYRDSIFKHRLKDRFVITEVELRLSRTPTVNISYPALAEAVGDREPSPAVVAEAVRRVRAKKLPAPSVIPNTGSFFKNPLVSARQYERLQKAHPALPAWAHGADYKLAAGWLVEQAGWRGFEEAGVGIYQGQALVLINPGHCSGQQVLALAARIQASVRKRFGVALDIEPRIY